MNRRQFVASGAVVTLGAWAPKNKDVVTSGAKAPRAEAIYPGVWKLRFGAPDAITPVGTRKYAPLAEALSRLPSLKECPVSVEGRPTDRGYELRIPLAPKEGVFGLGLQLYSLLQRGKKKALRVNADPTGDTGDTHAPVPFYVTTVGYGILVDTARYATFYCGGQTPKEKRNPNSKSDQAAILDALPEAHRKSGLERPSEVLAEIPRARGVDVYVFAGPSMRQAVQRYNLFSGGGALPPRWGLGVWYRAKADYKQDAILSLADDFRTSEMPCEVIGLEPGWQTHAYSCTYVWSDKFPDPAAMVKQLADRHFRLNLWEHSFTNPASPIHQALIPNSGDYEVWGGLVPDFLLPATQRIFSDFHAREHVAIGVSGYKLDECDNSDFTGGWSFPEASKFPSGVDGEQMHCLFGRKYQDTIQGIFDERKQRTYGMVRSAQALAAPYPYVLYSDLYEHRDFIRGLVNSGFSGLLWTPELRDATSTEDLLRRLQSVIFSPMAIINAWYIRNPPWKQVNMDANNAGNFDANWKDIEASCRKFLQLRMRFIPYLHAAFVRYNQEGIPPFRSVAMDFPDDPRTWLSDQDYMVGEDLLVAPVVAGDKTRSVYLPEGTWLDFWTGKEFSGKQAIEFEVPLDRMQIFVKAGSIIPLATPTLHTEDPASWTLQIQKYGSGASSTTLYEDDGSFDPRLVQVDIEWDGKTNAGTLRTGTTGANTRYKVDQWIVVKGENG